MKISNRAKKRMRDRALFCKATGNYKEAIETIKELIEIENKELKVFTKKLSSKSWVSVPVRPQCTDSRVMNYNKGDYYYNPVSYCSFKRKSNNEQASVVKKVAEEVLN